MRAVSICSQYNRLGLALVLLSLFVVPVPSPAAEEYEKFYGDYVGSTDFEEDGQMKHRDLSVSIKRAKKGFNVKWTTTKYKGTVRSDKSYSIDFEPTERDSIYSSAMKTNVFGGREALDPLKGDPYVWARITGDTLTVFGMLITDDGGWEMQVYDRTLTADGLHLQFHRTRNNQQLRTIEADLVRQ